MSVFVKTLRGMPNRTSMSTTASASITAISRCCPLLMTPSLATMMGSPVFSNCPDAICAESCVSLRLLIRRLPVFSASRAVAKSLSNIRVRVP